MGKSNLQRGNTINFYSMFRTIAKRLSHSLQTSLETKLATAFPNASAIQVVDTSGGCGSGFEICVIDSQFKSLNKIKSQRLVNKVIKEELKDIHSIRLKTKSE